MFTHSSYYFLEGPVMGGRALYKPISRSQKGIKNYWDCGLGQRAKAFHINDTLTIMWRFNNNLFRETLAWLKHFFFISIANHFRAWMCRATWSITVLCLNTAIEFTFWLYLLPVKNKTYTTTCSTTIPLCCVLLLGCIFVHMHLWNGYCIRLCCFFHRIS